MKLSVVIVNYKVPHFLELTIKSALKAAAAMQAAEPAWQTELWMVDNNSGDNSVEMVEAMFPSVKVIANKENTGFSKGNNQASRQSAGEYLLLLNPDTIVGEHTFLDCIRYMDAHQDVGGLGVMMVDGSGTFLPESKRGLPTPAVSFYKISGLSRLFPHSRRFGRYHLGFLDKDETHEVDVLPGAYMLMRKETLDQVGLLDETFFMYGEDIDLSYRIQKGGWKNVYFPKTKIVHFKGESTKKGSLNYVFVFYQAMVIFAKKHFSRRNAELFSSFIHIGIYLRAGVAVLARIVNRLLLPLLDFGVLYFFMAELVSYWERTIKYINNIHGHYPPELMNFYIPMYILLWMSGLFFAGGYSKPYSLRKIIRGTALGTLVIASVYAFLPETERFSRALIALGAVLAVAGFALVRAGLTLIKEKRLRWESSSVHKIAIVADQEEAERIKLLLNKAHVQYTTPGFISPDAKTESNPDCIGSLHELAHLVNVYGLNEVIFSAGSMPYEQIIHTVRQHHKLPLHFRFVAEGSRYIIGSSSKNTRGDYYQDEEPLALQDREQQVNKRLFDIVVSLMLLLSLPFTFWLVNQKGGYVRNIFQVLLGRKTWVGYSTPRENLPRIRPGVLSPSDQVRVLTLDETTRARLDYLYVKDYSANKDMGILWAGFVRLGQ